MTNVFAQFHQQKPSEDGGEANVFAQFHQPRQPRPDEAPGMLESFARGAVSGATFGFDDELGMDKQRREAGRQANPWTTFAGEVVGAVVPMVAAGPVGAAARGAAVASRAAGGIVGTSGVKAITAATRAAEAVLAPGRVANLGQAAVQGAKVGAAQGALSGAGNADVREGDTLAQSLQRRAGGAVAGGATGAVLGPVVGAVGYGAGRAAQQVLGARAVANAETDDLTEGSLRAIGRGLERDRIEPADLIRQVRSEFPDDTATAGGRRYWGNRQPWTPQQVDEVVQRALAGEDAATISQALGGPGQRAVQTLLDEMATRSRGPVNLVDRAGMVRSGSGDNTQMTLRAAAATPGQGRSIAREELIERQIGANGRLQAAFDRLIGSGDYEGVAARHTDDLRVAADAAYGAARAAEAPFDLNPIVAPFMRRFGGQRGPVPEAVNAAIDSIMTQVPIRNQMTGAVVGNHLRPPQTLEQFINARQNISAAIEAANGRPSVQRPLIELRDALSAEVRRTNPLWGQANDLYRDGRAASDMLEAGARMSTRLNARTREGLTDFRAAQVAERRAVRAKDQAGAAAARAQQELFRVGLVRSLNDMLSNNQGTADLTRTLRLPGARSMLESVLGREKAVQLFRVIDAEHAMHRTYSSQFGSQTTPLKEAVDDLNWAPRFQASWNPSDWIGMAGEYAARRMNADRNTRMMPVMTDTNPLRQIAVLRALQNIQTVDDQWAQGAVRPAVASAGPIVNALVGEQNANWSKNYGYRQERRALGDRRDP